MIKRIIKRDEKRKAGKLDGLPKCLFLDFGIFRNTNLTVFESLVKFLKEDKKLSYHEISLLLGRDERNIWTVYNRAKKKS